MHRFGGVITVIQPVPLVSVNADGTIAVSFADVTNVVASCDDPQNTADDGTKFAPVTVSVNEFPPGAIDTGLIASTNGTGGLPTPPAAVPVGASASATTTDKKITSTVLLLETIGRTVDDIVDS
jgi:hypothetical protein